MFEVTNISKQNFEHHILFVSGNYLLTGCKLWFFLGPLLLGNTVI